MNRKYRQWAAQRFFKRLALVILLPLFVVILPIAWGTCQVGRLFYWLRG